MNIEKKLVDNYWAGRKGETAKAVVIHIAQGSIEGAYSWFNTPSSQVSAHYMIAKDGRCWQFVEESDTAWHCAPVKTPTKDFLKYHNPDINPNLYTIGIEHEGATGDKWTPQMLEATRTLMIECAKRYGWERYEFGKNILEHGSINSVDRAQCPGTGVHITNDLILPVNKILMGDKELYKWLAVDRPDVAASYTEDNILEWWRPIGEQDLAFQLGKARRFDVLELIISKAILIRDWYVNGRGTDIEPNPWTIVDTATDAQLKLFKIKEILNEENN